MKDRTLLLGRLEWGLALAASAFSLVLHWRWKIHAGALWRDEVGTVEFATLPGFKEIWKNLAYDNFPPLVLVPLRLWSAIAGASDASWRWFGLLMGIAVLAVMWVVGRKFPTRTPLTALVFVGLSPLAVRTIDSIRPNGLGILLACATFGCFWLAATEPKRWTALWAAGAAILSVQCLYTNAAFVLASACAAAALTLRHRNRQGTIMMLAAGAVAAVSLLIHAGHLKAGRAWGIVALPVTPVRLTQLFEVNWQALLEPGPIAAIALIAVAPPIFLGVAIERLLHPKHGSRRRSDSRESSRGLTASDSTWFAGVALGVGTLAYFALLMKSGLPTQPWYYVILITFIALCADAAVPLSETARWWRLGLAAGAGLFAIAPAWSGTALRQTNVDLLAQKVQTMASKDDFILVNPWYYSITWQRYYHGDTPWETVPPLADHRIHRYDLIKEQMMRTNQAAIMQPVLERVRTTLQNGHRVWLVGGFQPPSTMDILPPAPQSNAGWCAERYQDSWALQLSTPLQAHVTQPTPVSLAWTNAVNPFEKVDLIVMEGWRVPVQ